ncbi:MAG: LytTR family transcriptional regulator [Acidobacteria bacterium]|nr:LytTR family transcriptional regulator [Acidobacteriota bacterium]
MNDTSADPKHAFDRDDGRALTFGRYLVVAGSALTVLFASVAPEATASLDFPRQLLFWALQMGSALSVFSLVLRLLAPLFGAGRGRAVLLVLGSGAIGTLPFTVIHLATEKLFGLPEIPDDPIEVRLAAFGYAGALAAEYLGIVVGATATWLVIHVPWLVRLDLSVHPAPLVGSSRTSVANARTEHLESVPGEPAPAISATAGIEEGDDAAQAFFRRLPVPGRDLITLSSELHYLRVRTSAGETLLLCSLKDAIEELGADLGLRVHRSHWVARKHVARVRREGRGLVCVLSNGAVIPVSRGSQRDVLETFGDRARYLEVPERSRAH